MTASAPLSTDGLAAPQVWSWQGFPICYQTQGQTGPAIVLIHGFGACWGHWRKTIPVLAQTCRVYAIDLIGFGASAKPVPGQPIAYTFETWGQQIVDFCREVVGSPAVLIGNSVGCIVAMQAAVVAPDQVVSVALLNCSLRLLHDRRRAEQPWYRQIGAPLLQKLLSIRGVGHSFFRAIAKPNTVRKILLKAYARPEAVTDELIELLMAPASDPGAADVFLAFTAYSQGPLPEDLLAVLPCPALVIWGEADPWEPVARGREFAHYPAVREFVSLAGVGHCPQDEAPEQINPILQRWIEQEV
ncbi:alpha/beta fold hydrolase [Leptolyngbya sp. NK1-12]|uniref:Alpha/beta fold hydrolase n=1 Tax=Leptolyngbya sp. NK1-12 TaxID=2547451 RepID=A0AA96WKE5_9CYAN|nr:alpha/beta fold hydrolase [Leptolyngbya sp. NK1-12]